MADHDRINLGRLVKRLEKSVEGEDWSQDDGHNTWIKTQGTLQVCAGRHTGPDYAEGLLSSISCHRKLNMLGGY